MTVATITAPEPTAVEPSRVLVLNDDEQRLLLDMLGAAGESTPQGRLYSRIAYGDEYINAKDELTRVTLRKRRLEAEIRRYVQAIARCEELVVEEFIANGDSGAKHAATGAALVMTRKVWAKLEVDTDGLPSDEVNLVRGEAKARAAEGLIAVGLGHYVKPDFNLNSISAYFREQVKAYDAEQKELPEHKRVPRVVDDFLPEELRGLLRLDDEPTISVRS